jgi:hypothetical protein
MDDAVIASMAKWPNVPDCYGWLHLDAQGRWLLGEWGKPLPESRPSVVEHTGLQQFINRNYLQPTPANSPHPLCWALQNGPQRVWATLALAPLIITLHGGTATAHTGQTVDIQAVYLADDGVVYFATSGGPAALASRSMEAFASGVTTNSASQYDWQAQPQQTKTPMLPIQRCCAADVTSLLGFNRQPSHAHTP